MANDEWRTPKWVWEPYGPFDLDAAATAENTLAPKFITKEMNAFAINWTEVCKPPAKVWCNPPYSQAAGPLSHWIDRFLMWQHPYHIIALLPADTSTKWFHSLYNMHNKTSDVKLTFLRPRVRHIDPQTGKPGGSPKFGSLIAEFKPWA